MEEAIRQFNTQFEWKPTVVNGEQLSLGGSTSKRGLEVEPLGFRKFILDGMGGSHLAADLLLAYRPEIDLSVFSDYGIPSLPPARLKDALLIASSFSGNTEEPIDFAEKALAKGLPLAVIAKGGKLLEFAKIHNLSHVALPPTKIQPRSGLGFQILALAALLREESLLRELAELASALRPAELEGKGKELAAALRGEIPVIYASARNQAIAYNWKIKFNETGKVPSFFNIFPELNHNEMTGFDITPTTEGLSRKFHFIFLTDSADHPKIGKRMQMMKKLYEDRGLSVTEMPIEDTPPAEDGSAPLDRGDNRLQKMFSSLLIADWTALHLSKIYGTEAEQVPMVEEFKRLIA